MCGFLLSEYGICSKAYHLTKLRNFEGFRHFIKAGVAQWLKIWPGHQKVASLNPIK